MPTYHEGGSLNRIAEWRQKGTLEVWWDLYWWYFCKFSCNGVYIAIYNSTLAFSTFSHIGHEIYSCIFQLQSYRPYDLLLHFPVLRNLRFSQYNLGLVFHTIYSCIFHPCSFARIAFSTPAFSVPPIGQWTILCASQYNNQGAEKLLMFVSVGDSNRAGRSRVDMHEE